jgi:flagellar hook-basal body complex protein FliE
MTHDPLGLVGSAGGGIQPIRPISIGQTKPGQENSNFKDVLMKNIEQVNKLQQDAQSAIEDLATGKRDDVTGVLMAKQKADLAFQMLVQVRNKMVSAYEEIKQIRV